MIPVYLSHTFHTIAGSENIFHVDFFESTPQALPFDYSSVMSHNLHKFSRSGQIPTSSVGHFGISTHGKYASELDYLHINLLYCGGMYDCSLGVVVSYSNILSFLEMYRISMHSAFIF